MGIITEIFIAHFDFIFGPVKLLSYPDHIDNKLVEFAILSSVYLFQLENPPTEHPVYLALTDYKKKGLIYVKRMPHSEEGKRAKDYILFLLVNEQDDAILYKYERDISSHVVEFMKTFFTPSIFLQSDIIKDLMNHKEQLNAEIANLIGSINNQLQEFLVLENQLPSQTLAFPEQQESGNDREYEMKLVVLGDPSVGKTSSIIRYTDRAFRRSYIPTVGVNITEKKIKTPIFSINVMIWDLAGHVKFEKVRRNYYSGAAGCLLLFDLTNPESFKSISSWYKDLNTNFAPYPVPIILVGNKSDLIAERTVSHETIQQFLDQSDLKYFETSAMTGQNIDSAFDLLIAEIMKSISQ